MMKTRRKLVGAIHERIDDVLGVPKTVVAQCLGGIFFSIFAGQPLIVVMTTAPLTLYVKGLSVHC